ncbi:unnamed protein product [Onchocerca flexuosa]|uniref:Uncharacterized protein n=1 Tax=Onchocerca flexuosa TaxID=387005 RepID=A0A183HQ55_9BILA|nr:unnamed protein product [Onchocerca flexuosa]
MLGRQRTATVTATATTTTADNDVVDDEQALMEKLVYYEKACMSADSISSLVQAIRRQVHAYMQVWRARNKRAVDKSEIHRSLSTCEEIFSQTTSISLAFSHLYACKLSSPHALSPG